MSYQLQVKQNVLDFRTKNGFSSKEPIDLEALLQKLRILTLFKPLDDSISGIVGKTDEETRFMLVNSNHTLGRQHFTIAHELYHLFYDPTFEVLVCGSAIQNTEEKKANQFSALLLIPEDGLLEHIPENELKKNTISIPTLLSIELNFKCSRSALLNRLSDIDIITKDFKENLSQDIETEAIRYGFSTELYQPGNKGKIIGDYLILNNALYEKGIISETSYRTFLLDIGREDSALDAVT